ncbi:MAG: ABC transporter ATP-binding protein [Planctomycetota bacterium]|nr:ABC transporter ATP-binding protein [Planctomycetota bacterium]
MISVTLENLCKTYGQTVAVDGVTLEAPKGGLTFLLGPSGCGKTTILRMIAGFLEPSAGVIRFGDRDVTSLSAEKRDCGMVFQSYALWPHMTVAQNVAFGLEVRKVPTAEMRKRVGEALEMVRMGTYAERKPNQLSGGQQQRVALARAIVYRPDVLLLDEPLSNLDAKLRLEMRGEIRRIVDDLRVTAIYVTHDQKESLSLADKMVVLRDGRIEQVGGPRELYERPCNRFVAEFLGETNFLAATIDVAAHGSISSSPRLVKTSAGILETTTASDRSTSASLVASVRPESLRMHPEHSVAADRPALRGVVAESTYLGEVAQHRVDCKGTQIKVFELNPRHLSRRGEPVALTVDADQVVMLDR